MIRNDAEYEKAKQRRHEIADDLDQWETELISTGLSPSELKEAKEKPSGRYARIKKELDKIDKKIRDYEERNSIA